jgi:hypothetical protein
MFKLGQFKFELGPSVPEHARSGASRPRRHAAPQRLGPPPPARRPNAWDRRHHVASRTSSDLGTRSPHAPAPASARPDPLPCRPPVTCCAPRLPPRTPLTPLPRLEEELPSTPRPHPPAPPLACPLSASPPWTPPRQDRALTSSHRRPTLPTPSLVLAELPRPLVRLHCTSFRRNQSRGGSTVAVSPPPLAGIIFGRATTLIDQWWVQSTSRAICSPAPAVVRCRRAHPTTERHGCEIQVACVNQGPIGEGP